MRVTLTQVVNTYFQPEGKEALMTTTSFSKVIDSDEDVLNRTVLLKKNDLKSVHKAWLDRVGFIHLHNQGIVLTENPDEETKKLLDENVIEVYLGDVLLFELRIGMSISLPISEKALSMLQLRSNNLDVYLKYSLFPG